MKNIENLNIAVIGLGYVGLPLATNFGIKYNTIGYDIDEDRISQLKNNIDVTREVSEKEILKSKKIKFSCKEEDLKKANIYIITVPTPITKFLEPNLDPIFSASKMVGKYLSKGDIVIYESTVYPGCTEDDCVPILEKFSKLTYGIDFTCGYSPERLVPGDKEKTLTKILKIVSGTDNKTTTIINDLYKSIIKAGTYIAPSIKVAEAAKAIENAQRDINIAFVNELSLIFDKMNINTNDVLEAAATKWNFLPFKPGLVGGHCIGVDPYYLSYKSASFGHHPKLILAGREINDNMSEFIVKKILKKMTKNNINIADSKILILGITFKENCPDIRNTKVKDVVSTFSQFNCNIDICDPVADKDDVNKELDIDLKSLNELDLKYDAILRLVNHDVFENFDYKKYKNKSSIIFDLKGLWDEENILSL